MKTIAFSFISFEQPIMSGPDGMNFNKAKRNQSLGDWKHSKKFRAYFHKKQHRKNKLKNFYKSLDRPPKS